jgi:acetaldehyde dehydrogenase/alcohol dehydrogenase
MKDVYQKSNDFLAGGIHTPPCPNAISPSGSIMIIYLSIYQGDGVHPDDKYAPKKLSPTLGMFHAKSFEHAVEQAKMMVEIGGFGHTSCLYTDKDLNTECIQYFAESMKTARILLNIPTSNGGIGNLYNFKLDPLLTLG